MKIKLILSILSLLFLSNITYGESFKAITSITSSGDTSGGIRYDFENGTVIDGGITRNKKNGTSFWIDGYYSFWGIYASGTTSKLTSLACMFAVEHETHKTTTSHMQE